MKSDSVYLDLYSDKIWITLQHFSTTKTCCL